jgi:hypothetical protein
MTLVKHCFDPQGSKIGALRLDVEIGDPMVVNPGSKEANDCDLAEASLRQSYDLCTFCVRVAHGLGLIKLSRGSEFPGFRRPLLTGRPVLYRGWPVPHVLVLAALCLASCCSSP